MHSKKLSKHCPREGQSNSYAIKDPNEYLTKGRQKEFISAYFDAKTYVPDGIVGSGQLYDKMLEYALVERIPLPPL